MCTFCRLAFAAFVGWMLSLACAAQNAVYPVPQECRVVAEKVHTVSSVSVKVREKGSSGGLWDRVRKMSGAYALRVSSGRVEVCAHDAAGAFYARQTLSQLVQGK
ncbi:MAG: glycoside hydrolase family 20 zincin-like fold domain-containing protein, partial [Akkermansia muciniphila]